MTLTQPQTSELFTPQEEQEASGEEIINLAPAVPLRYRLFAGAVFEAIISILAAGLVVPTPTLPPASTNNGALGDVPTWRRALGTVVPIPTNFPDVIAIVCPPSLDE